MVAIFKTGSSIKTTLNYNEQKVQQGKAECIMAENYPIDHDNMSFDQKISRLLNQAALNKNVRANSVHISLNFGPSEQLSIDTLKEIASDYMKQMGFREQPFLVYRHSDAGHPHIHIVSIKIRPDGKRIDTQNIGRDRSEKARKDIEARFGLVKAEDSKNSQRYKLEPVNARKVMYGKMETKRSIGNVLSAVLDNYKYSSLPELNALLSLYNITADRGSEHSNMRAQKGLLYRVLDEQGNKIGAPVKASQFFMKPTLANLEKKFSENELSKEPFKKRIKSFIDFALLKEQQLPLDKLIEALKKEGIDTVLRKSTDGRIYGMTYVDHKAKAVFNGSELGKQYSAKAMQERCATGSAKLGSAPATRSAGSVDHQPAMPTESYAHKANDTSLLDLLTQAEQSSNATPFELKKSRKKKRRRVSK